VKQNNRRRMEILVQKMFLPTPSKRKELHPEMREGPLCRQEEPGGEKSLEITTSTVI